MITCDVYYSADAREDHWTMWFEALPRIGEILIRHSGKRHEIVQIRWVEGESNEFVPQIVVSP